MGITISAHALKQAAERGITEEGIEAIIDAYPRVHTQSEIDPDAILVYGMYEDNVWIVIINQETSNVITVRRASKKERGKYEKKKGN